LAKLAEFKQRMVVEGLLPATAPGVLTFKDVISQTFGKEGIYDQDVTRLSAKQRAAYERRIAAVLVRAWIGGRTGRIVTRVFQDALFEGFTWVQLGDDEVAELLGIRGKEE